MNQNLYLQLFEKVGRSRGKVLINMPDSRLYTGSDVATITRKLASLLKELGVVPGERVAAQVDKSPEAVMLYLACLQVGAIYLPLNPAYTESETEYFLSDAEPHLFVCRPAAEAESAQLASKCAVPHLASLGTDADGTLMQRARESQELTDVATVASDDLASILYTSGTTGRSKGAMLSHGNLASNCRALAELWQFTADDHLLHALPIFHTHGLFVACNVVLTAGASMTFMPRLDIDQLIALMPKATVLMGVPTFYSRLLQSPKLDRSTASNMRLFISGSAPLSAEVHEEFQARTGHAILERYGMTETNMNTSNPYKGERRPGTVGFPLPGTEVRICDRETGAALEGNETGMIQVRGPNVFKGYWRMPEKTKEDLLDDGFFITGDLGLVDEQGYLHIVGRDKDLIISGGFNIYPKEIEQLIDELDGVSESAVFGAPHPDLGEGVAAAVVLRPGTELDAEQIQTRLAAHLARYKQPRRIFVVDALPRNVMGKVQKNELRRMFEDAYRA